MARILKTVWTQTLESTERVEEGCSLNTEALPVTHAQQPSWQEALAKGSNILYRECSQCKEIIMKQNKPRTGIWSNWTPVPNLIFGQKRINSHLMQQTKSFGFFFGSLCLSRASLSRLATLRGEGGRRLVGGAEEVPTREFSIVSFCCCKDCLQARLCRGDARSLVWLSVCLQVDSCQCEGFLSFSYSFAFLLKSSHQFCFGSPPTLMHKTSQSEVPQGAAHRSEERRHSKFYPHLVYCLLRVCSTF